MLSLDGTVVTNQLAVSDEVGSAEFHANKIETTNSLLASADTGTRDDYFRDTVETIKVQTTTIDQYCEDNAIQRINILKMDTQGGELKALMGAKDLIAKKKIDLIYCEVSFTKMYEESPLFHDIAIHLEANGYRLHNIYSLHSDENGRLGWGDAIFVLDR